VNHGGLEYSQISPWKQWQILDKKMMYGELWTASFCLRSDCIKYKDNIMKK
jgi:hypothetical protein